MDDISQEGHIYAHKNTKVSNYTLFHNLEILSTEKSVVQQHMRREY